MHADGIFKREFREKDAHKKEATIEQDTEKPTLKEI